MPISITCPGCGKRLKGPDTLAGRTVDCPACGYPLLIPGPEDEAGHYLLREDEVPEEPAPEVPHGRREDEPAPAPPPRRRPGMIPARRPAAALPPLRSEETPLWLRHLHWLLALALIPLGFSLLQKDDQDQADFVSRLEKTVDEAPPDVQGRVIRVLQNLEKEGSLEDVFAALPGEKLAGALLSRRTWIHWAFAAGAAVLFLAFLLFLAVDGAAQGRHLLAVGLFTATAGILFLLLVQALAQWSQGVWLRGGSVLVLIFYAIKLIGFSYQAALDPQNGFLLSFLGFTLGVGFCEEVCKALPLLWHYRQPSGQRWRGALLLGLASGAAFGIAEGIMYSRSYYNGIRGPDAYLVRFLSCVALHVVWTGAVAITLHRNQEMIQKEMPWYEFVPPLFYIVGVPMVLHGLYDTLLKKDMNAAALVVAVLSFLYLAFQISRLGGEDDAAAREKLFREYRRRREAMG
jgi:RsiW-degrading membrane proteinase PrsW (M82 family)